MQFFIGENSVYKVKAGVAELADALDSKSSGRKVVWVRAPPPAMNSQLIFDVGR
jgi:hypothetical protein